MDGTKNYSLDVLKESLDLATDIYKFANQLPEKEKFGIWSQITRAGVSVPSNIAEGQHKTIPGFIKFLNDAKGSLNEVMVQLEIIRRVYNLDITELMKKSDKIGGMIYGLIRALNRKEESIDTVHR